MRPMDFRTHASLSATLGLGISLGGVLSFADQCVDRFVFGHEMLPREFSHDPVDIPEFLTVLVFCIVLALLGLLLMLFDKHVRVYKLKSRFVSSSVGKVGLVVLIAGLIGITRQFRDNVIGLEWTTGGYPWLVFVATIFLVLSSVVMLLLDRVGASKQSVGGISNVE